MERVVNGIAGQKLTTAELLYLVETVKSGKGEDITIDKLMRKGDSTPS